MGELTQIEGKKPEFVGDILLSITPHYSSVKVWTPFGTATWDQEILPDYYNITVRVYVKDNAGIDYVIIKCQGEDPVRVNMNGVREGWANATFTVGYLRTYTTGYDITVSVYDKNGYGVEGTGHIDGLLEKIVKAIISGLVRVGKAIVEFVEDCYNWIIDLILSGIEKLYSPLINKWENAAESAANRLVTFFSQYEAGSLVWTFTEEDVENFWAGFLKSIFGVIMAITALAIGFYGTILVANAFPGVGLVVAGVVSLSIVTFFELLIYSSLKREWGKKAIGSDDAATYTPLDAISDVRDFFIGLELAWAAMVAQKEIIEGYKKLGITMGGQSLIGAIFSILLLTIGSFVDGIVKGMLSLTEAWTAIVSGITKFLIDGWAAIEGVWSVVDAFCAWGAEALTPSGIILLAVVTVLSLSALNAAAVSVSIDVITIIRGIQAL